MIERYLDFRSKGHARLHIAQCREVGAYFKAAIGKHGALPGYVESLRILLDEMSQAHDYLELR